jgi:hypothetical protein
MDVGPGPVRVKVAAVRVAPFIGLLNVAATVEFRATADALFAGTVDTIVGATSVVNVHE